MNDIPVILEKITDIVARQKDMNKAISSINEHIGVLNDHSGTTAVALAQLTTKIDIFEKLLWIVIGASITAIAGSVWSIILHRRSTR